MDVTAAILASLVAGAAYFYGNRTGRSAGIREAHKALSSAIIKFSYSNPGISEQRIHDIANSLIESEGDMHEQAINHIRQAAQEAVGLKEQA